MSANGEGFYASIPPTKRMVAGVEAKSPSDMLNMLGRMETLIGVALGVPSSLWGSAYTISSNRFSNQSTRDIFYHTVRAWRSVVKDILVAQFNRVFSKDTALHTAFSGPADETVDSASKRNEVSVTFPNLVDPHVLDDWHTRGMISQETWVKSTAMYWDLEEGFFNRVIKLPPTLQTAARGRAPAVGPVQGLPSKRNRAATDDEGPARKKQRE
jgi:hypothetical protein